MNVYENLAFALKLRKTPVEEINEKVREASKILGIESLLERLPKQLSGGQRQRVALGRAIVRNPKVFLMDEPLSNLDAKLRVQMRSELIRLHHKLNTTIIYVTHDQVEAMTMGDRICIYYDGFVQQCDTPQQVYNSPANLFVAGFIGSPAMNFVDVVYDQGKLIYKEHFQLEVSDAKKSLLASYQGKTVVLGFRPEHVGISGQMKEDVSEGSKIKSVVDVVEHMGNEIFLTTKTGEKAFMARIPAEAQVAFNQAVELCVDMEKIHVFDKNTEKAIR
jgi:multiple sugar transport system ATP-binding protein